MKRQRRFWLVLTGLACGLLTRSQAADAPPASSSLLVYIGTYTSGKSRGIYRAWFDTATGRLTAPALAAETKNPSFLARSPGGGVLYAVSEQTDAAGNRGGAVSAFRIEAPSGNLTFLNRQSSGGAGPCYVAVDQTGKSVLVANYGSGSVAVLPVRADATLGEASAFVQHAGSSVNPSRQAGPHAHFIVATPDNRFAVVCDLGLDRVLVYRFDSHAGTLTPNDPPSVSLKPGSGPRHLAFHPNGRFVYLLNEMGGTLTAFDYEAQRGALKEIQTLSALPENFKGENTSAEVQVHPAGSFVYASNRGADAIAVFAVDQGSGKLRWVESQSTLGKTPRFFTLSPDGNWLLAANQNSDNIVLFQVNARTGRLTPTGQTVEVGSPVCCAFLGPR